MSFLPSSFGNPIQMIGSHATYPFWETVGWDQISNLDPHTSTNEVTLYKIWCAASTTILQASKQRKIYPINNSQINRQRNQGTGRHDSCVGFFNLFSNLLRKRVVIIFDHHYSLLIPGA